MSPTKEALTNVSFDFLANSSEFLNLLLSNISSCVLILNKDMELQAWNDPIKTIFSNSKNEDLKYMRCGEAIGCAYQIDEQEKCGKTRMCCNCELRVSAMHSYLNDQVIYKEKIVRPFYTNNHQKVEKHLNFSTRIFNFEQDKYIMLIVDDITKFNSSEPA